jgi:L-lactate utilization protein LutB
MDSNRQEWIEERMKRTVENLRAHDFEALCVKTKEEATKEIWKYVGPTTQVGVGGSVTLRELGILDALRAQGHPVYDHWAPGLSKEQNLQVRRSQMTCDLFLSSVNAVTQSGELVNIDGCGNRVNSTVFGPQKVILVAGHQKIVNNLEEALRRVKDVATPINAKRLGIDVPCVKAGKCVDCRSPHRMCRVVVIHERKPHFTDMLIIIVGEELGY